MIILKGGVIMGITNYSLIYNFDKIKKRFKEFIKQKTYDDSLVDYYIEHSMKDFTETEFKIMKETTVKHKESIIFQAALVIATLTAIFTLLSILVAAMKTVNLYSIIILIFIYLTMLVFYFSWVVRHHQKTLKIMNLLDIAIRKRGIGK